MHQYISENNHQNSYLFAFVLFCFTLFCFPVAKCLPVKAPENGRIVMTGAFELNQEYSFGQVVEFECNKKYRLVGSKEIHCSSDGRWDSDVPQCQGKWNTIICNKLYSHIFLGTGYHLGNYKAFTLLHSN